LNIFVEKAVFVGIRNHGSIEALKPYLHSDKFQDKLVYQPCMTTLISKIYPQFIDYTQKEDFVAFNCAFDRQQLRSSDDAYLYSIARVAKEICKITKVKYYSHVKSDLKALPYFDKIGVKYELVEMHDVKKMIVDYTRPRLVIGMRGHAQMIPFGCQTPILSIISHNKMQWFLDDISHPDWGVDVMSMDFEEKLYTKAKNLYINYQQAHNEIVTQQQKLWEVTKNNINIIKDQLIKK
jgi:polysaccharide pyruvyl transferase WcaK-like protein